MEEEKFPHNRKPSYSWVCGEFWNLRGQHNQEKERKKERNKQKNTEYMPNCNCGKDNFTAKSSNLTT